MNVQRPIPPASGLVAELVDLIGQEKTAALADKFGGTRLYVPRVIGPHHDIAHTIGMKASALLAERFGLTSIELPNPNVRRQRALDAALSGTMTRAEVARAFGYTERAIYKMLAHHASEQDTPQLDLFG